MPLPAHVNASDTFKTWRENHNSLIDNVLSRDHYWTIERDLEIVVGNFVEAGVFFRTNGAHSFAIDAVVSDTNFSVSKKYTFTTNQTLINSLWYKVEPVHDTGAYNGNDFQLEVNRTEYKTYIRITRTLGTVAGSVFLTVFAGEDGEPLSFTPRFSTGTATTEPKDLPGRNFALSSLISGGTF